MLKFIKILLGYIFLCVLVSHANAARDFIIDTDLGMDDVVAILYMLNISDINVKAITIAGNSEVHCAPGLKNIASMLELTHHENIPIACGSERPLLGNHHFPEFVRTSADNFFDITKLESNSKIMSSAETLLEKTLRDAQQPMDILAIAPLTNIAGLITKNPALINKIHRIYIMGGAVNVLGNLEGDDKASKNDAAEWNIYIDPAAADIVFRSGAPLTLVPLDLTNQVPVDENFYQDLKKHQSTPSGQLAFSIYHHFVDRISGHYLYFWDPVTAVIASDSSLVKIKNKKLRIALAPETQSGATVIDEKNGNLVQVCETIDKDKFKKMLLDTVR